MTREAAPIDLSTMPDLARLAREVARDGTPRVLREEGADVAVISPARPKRRRTWKRPSEEDIARSLAAAGSWEGIVDPERLKRELDEARSDDRPPVEL